MEKIEKNNFKEENKTLNRAKKEDISYEDLVTSYENMLGDFKETYSTTQRHNKIVEAIEKQKNEEIEYLKKELKTANKRGLNTAILLVLAGVVIAGIGIILM